MPHQVPIKTIVDATIEGISKAQSDYELWSGGCWLWEAPEYLSTTYVAREISLSSEEKGKQYVTMEHGTKTAIVDAGARRRGNLHRKMRPNGRVDLLLWWVNGTPRAPIEIKCQISVFSSIKSDIDRIEKIIHRNSTESSFQFGMMAFYTSLAAKDVIAAKEKMKIRLKSIKSSLNKYLEKNSPNTKSTWHNSKIQTADESAWAVVAIVLQPK